MNIAVLVMGMAAILMAASKPDSEPPPEPLPPKPEDPHPEPFSEHDPFRGSPTDLVQMVVLKLTCKGCGAVVAETVLPQTADGSTILSFVDADFLPAWQEHVKRKHFLRYVFICHPKFEYTYMREWRKKDGHARLS